MEALSRADPLVRWMIVGILSLCVVLFVVVRIAAENTASRNLVLATAALGAAVILYLIQIPLELHRSISYDHISAEFTTDRGKPEIRQWIYTSSGLTTGWRMGIETNASSWLAANNPLAFNQDLDKLTSDFFLFSLVSFFTVNEFDWQLKRTIFKGKTSGIVYTAKPVSKRNDCSSFSEQNIRDRLSQAGNLFAGAHLTVTSGRLCLPPRSVLGITANSLVIRNPICEVSFNVEHSGSVNYTKPSTGGLVAPQLAGGGAQYETRLIGLEVQTTYFALRSQHGDSEKYRDWCSRVINGAREWFET